MLHRFKNFIFEINLQVKTEDLKDPIKSVISCGMK